MGDMQHKLLSLNDVLCFHAGGIMNVNMKRAILQSWIFCDHNNTSGFLKLPTIHIHTIFMPHCHGQYIELRSVKAIQASNESIPVHGSIAVIHQTKIQIQILNQLNKTISAHR